MKELTPFHIALPVHNIKECKEFYVKYFDCEIGRETEQWVDLNLYGHQYVLHLDENLNKQEVINQVDSHAIPVPHCGVILKWDVWEKLAEKLKSDEIEFIVEPHIRFKDLPGEQATLFIKDPSGNALEFKSFKEFSQIFAK